MSSGGKRYEESRHVNGTERAEDREGVQSGKSNGIGWSGNSSETVIFKLKPK